MQQNSFNENDKEKREKLSTSTLILHNDDVNTFDYIIQSLIEICDHDPYQANQCALIAHYKGKCEIKRGDYNNLKNLMIKFSKRGIITSIQ